MFYCRCCFYFLQPEIFELCEPIGAKYCMVVGSRLNFIMPDKNFGDFPRKKFYGPKTCKICRNFGRLQT